MKLLANENIPLRSSQYLEEKGYDIVHIGITDPSITDEEVMKLAVEQNRIIITFDRDYSILVFRDGYRPPGDLPALTGLLTLSSRRTYTPPD